METAALTITPLCVGIASSFAAGRVGEWLDQLKKPRWNPPGWLFGPVWTALYLMMGYASSRVTSVAAISLYAIQLSLNALWMPVFSGLRRPGAALALIAALWGVLLATTVLFWREDTLAGALLLPYLAWVTFASVLNAEIVRLNV